MPDYEQRRETRPNAWPPDPEFPQGGEVGQPDLADKAREDAQEYASRAKETASKLGDRAQEQIEKGRGAAAEGMDRSADMVRERTSSNPQLANSGAKVAEGMEGAATYLREHNTSEIIADFEDYAREHPVQVLAGAVVAGFVIGRMLR